MSSATTGAIRQAKARCVQEALLHSWRMCSDREVAKAVGASNRTVSLARKRLEADGAILPRNESTQSVEACLYEVCTSAIEPAPLNDELYDPVNESEPSFRALSDSIRELGILEQIVVSADGYILSGHRRHAAARLLVLSEFGSASATTCFTASTATSFCGSWPVTTGSG